MLANVFRWFSPYWNRIKGTLGVLFVLTLLGIATRTLYPLIFKFIIDSLAGANPAESSNPVMSNIARWVESIMPLESSSARTWVLVLLFMGAMRSIVQAVLPSTRALGNLKLAKGIRVEILRRVLRKRHGFFQRFMPGDLVTRLTDDIDQFDKLSWFACSGVFRPIEAGLTLAFSLAIMFTLHWKLTLASTLPLPFIVWILSKTETLQHKRYAERQKATSKTVETLESAFSGSRIVMGFNMEGAQEQLFDEVLNEREEAEKRVVTLRAILEGFFSIMNQIGLVVVLFLGGWFVVNDPKFTIGDFYAFVAYLSNLTMPIWTISYFFVSTNLANASVKRMQEIEKEEEREPGEGKVAESHPVLQVDDVLFSYEDNTGAPLLNGINLIVRPGETVALVGPVGCGKSTLLECAVGLLEPTAGEVRLGAGQSLTSLSDDDRAGWVGYAPQEPLLFAGDVDMNVHLDREGITANTVQRSLRTACLSEEVPGDKEVAQAGKGLSGGQRARVALARALAGSPAILVLDDVTSALDAHTEKVFWDHVRSQLPDAGILVSTHREATAQRAERVLWLEGGIILHEGTHNQLLEEQPGYQKLFALS
ncbi:MAG: ABC transporter ATP-binding protein [bacterium]|nr:ABC transporter ATP-binding protein [bacterium]